MIRVIFTSEAAAAEYAANENGIYFPLPDGTFKVLVMEDWVFRAFPLEMINRGIFLYPTMKRFIPSFQAQEKWLQYRNK